MTTRNLAAWETNPSTGKLDSTFHEADYYIINGSGFGVKTSVPYYNDFENLSIGAVGSVSGLTISNGSGVSVSSSSPRSGTRYLQNDYNLERFPKINRGFATRSKRVKLSCWFRFDGTVTGGSNVWKFLRFNNTEGFDPYGDHNKFSQEFTSTAGLAYPSAQSSSVSVTGGGSNFSGDQSTLDDTPANLFINGQWLFYQAEIYAGTLGNADAKMICRINGKRVTNFTNVEFITAVKPLDVGFVLTPINGFDNYTSTTVVMKMDNLLIDQSGAECVMTDNAVFASSTNFEAQPISIMTDTKIYLTPKRGTFTQGQTAYYHIWNEDGSYNGYYVGVVV